MFPIDKSSQERSSHVSSGANLLVQLFILGPDLLNRITDGAELLSLRGKNRDPAADTRKALFDQNEGTNDPQVLELILGLAFLGALVSL